MDYNILRQIEKPIGREIPFIAQPNFQLTSFPAFDFVNPGLAQITRNYEFFIPLMSHGDQFRQKRKDNEKMTEVLGSGEDSITR